MRRSAALTAAACALAAVLFLSLPGGAASGARSAPPRITAAAPSRGTGLPAPGDRLRARVTAPAAYRWRRCDLLGEHCTPIAGARAATYRVGEADVGHTIRLAVASHGGRRGASGVSAATGVVVDPRIGTGPSRATCAGTCTVDSTGTSVNITVPDGAGATYSRAITVYAPRNLSGATPVVIVATDGAQPSASPSDSTDSFYRLAAAERFIVIRMTCATRFSTCGYATPAISPFVDFARCGPSGSGTCDDAPSVDCGATRAAPCDPSSATSALGWIEDRANLRSVCPRCSAVDTQRVFLTGGSKGGDFTEDIACDPATAPAIAGFTPVSAVLLSTSAAPQSSVPPSCPALLAPSSFTPRPPGETWPAMVQYVYGFQDTAYGGRPIGTVGGYAAQAHWVFGQIQNLTSFFDPAYRCANTLVGGSEMNVRGALIGTYGNCQTSTRVRTQYVDIAASACHAGGCEGIDGVDLASVAWDFWTTGTPTP